MLLLLQRPRKLSICLVLEASNVELSDRSACPQTFYPILTVHVCQMGHQSYKVRFQPKKISRIQFSIREDVSCSKLTTLTVGDKTPWAIYREVEIRNKNTFRLSTKVLSI